jgi:putative sigma-54 modulation protein
MNACPNPEDPPVTIAEEYDRKISPGEEGTWSADDFNRAGPSAGVRFTQNKRRNMNSQNHHEVIVSGIHLELTSSLKQFVHDKAERLFRHEERIVRLRVELECDRAAATGVQFKAKGHIQIHGPDMNAAVQAADCHLAISMLVDKLDRMLQRRHQLHRVKRNHPHAVELDADLPKIVA